MSLTDMIEAGSANPLLLFTFALALGALHGLEPGHSKTMMAAYIVAIQGTVKQAVLLGASAAFSHSIIVWLLAWAALSWGNELIGEELEPYFMILSGILVLGIAAWMLWRSFPAKASGHGHGHGHSHDHDHSHDNDQGHGHDHGHRHNQDHDHGHDHGHDHDHGHALALDADDGLDPHARAHAAEIRARLKTGRVGTGQAVLFGLSGGLIPCPAAITVFILCLHLGQVTLGVTLVGAFSLGLAVTLIAVGVVAALGLRFISGRTSRFDRIMKAAPWLSALLIACVGLVIIWSGVSHLHIGHTH